MFEFWGNERHSRANLLLDEPPSRCLLYNRMLYRTAWHKTIHRKSLHGKCCSGKGCARQWFTGQLAQEMVVQWSFVQESNVQANAVQETLHDDVIQGRMVQHNVVLIILAMTHVLRGMLYTKIVCRKVLRNIMLYREVMCGRELYRQIQEYCCTAKYGTTKCRTGKSCTGRWGTEDVVV